MDVLKLKLSTKFMRSTIANLIAKTLYKKLGYNIDILLNEIEVKSEGIYRSLHYIIKYKGYYVEIQGRTLFEEGWSEIDHDIVYPHNTDDEGLKDFSKLLNRLSGMADEMSSYFRKMKEERENQK